MGPRAGRKLLRDLGHFCRLFGEASVCLHQLRKLFLHSGLRPLSDVCIGNGFSPCVAFLSLS